MPDYDKFNLRFPPRLRERLEDAARANTRSLHAEIIFRLEQSFNLEPASSATREELLRMVNDAIDDRLQRLEEQKKQPAKAEPAKRRLMR